MADDPKHPYRSAAAPVAKLYLLDFGKLDEHARVIRHGLVAGAFDGVPRSQLAEMAASLEDMHAGMTRALAATQGYVNAAIALLAALTALASRVLTGPLGVIVPLVLIALLFVAGFVVSGLKGMEATLARVRDAYAELAKYASSLPLDQIPERVRVEVDALVGQEQPAMAFLATERKGEAKR